MGPIAAAIPAVPMIDAYTRLASMGATGPELATAIRHLWILAALFGLGAALAARSARPAQGLNCPPELPSP